MKNIRTLVLVGEKSVKEKFIFTLLDGNLPVDLRKVGKDTPLALELGCSEWLSGQQYSAKKGGYTKMQLKSPVLPYGLRILADFSGENWEQCSNTEEADMVLFVDAFPFAGESLLNDLKKIGKHLEKFRQRGRFPNTQFRVVFFLQRQLEFAETDLDRIEDALREAPKEIKEALGKELEYDFIREIIDFKTYGGSADLDEVFSYKGKVESLFSSLCYEWLEDWRFRLEEWEGNGGSYFWKYNFEYKEKFLDQRTLRQFVTGFAAVKGSEDVAAKYMANYFNYFWKDIKTLVSEVYRESVRNICFWDLEKDIEKLFKDLQGRYFASLNFKERYPCPKLQSDYEELKNKSKLVTNFNLAIEKFLEKEIPELIYHYLRRKAETLLKIFGFQ